MLTMRSIRLLLILGLCFTSIRIINANEPTRLVPKQIDLPSKLVGGGWKVWESIGNIEGIMTHRERVTALASHMNAVWVGTSHGRLFHRRADEWILHGQLNQIQITGIEIDSTGRIWLSTSDGIRRIEQDQDKNWKVAAFRHYYEGHPSFVSGGYIPGEDATRPWGYTDDIYIPKQVGSDSIYVISHEHGLFSAYGGYGGIWHSFIPHYWGASSGWLDTRELTPHRRPTCMIEGKDGYLWIGTEWDGLVRLNAKGRHYSKRKSDNNKKDGTEFSFIGPKEVGCDFDRVVALAISEPKGVWAVLSSRKSGHHIAHFDGDTWTTLAFDKELSPASLLETAPGVLLVGNFGNFYQGIKKVTWSTKQVENINGPKGGVHELVKLPDGRLFAASMFALYELSKP